MKMLRFPTKGYGRIFCQNGDKIKVEKIIQSMDDFEYSYLPLRLISEGMPIIHSDKDGHKYIDVTVEYTHKFDDLDLNELQMRCFMANIPIVIWIASEDYCQNDSSQMGQRIYL